MKQIVLFFAFMFLLLNVKAQSIFETYTNNPTYQTVTQTVAKPALSFRLGNGSATIIPVFEGDRWDEDSKNAVQYACQLLEEYLPTTYPIKIKFVRSSSQNSPFVTTIVRYMNNSPTTNDSSDPFGGQYARIPLSISTQRYYTKVPSASLKRYAVLGTETMLFHQEESLFSDFDGTVTFSNQDIFSTRTDGTVDEGMYDLTTVTLREIFKILGLASTAKRTATNELTVIDGNGMITPYDYLLFLSGYDPHNKIANYNYATSGNANLLHWQNRYPIYSPSTYNVTKSLQYFPIDPNNLETLLLQPDLPKETSILKIGSIFRDALNHIGWMKRNDFVGIGNEETNYGQQINGELINPFSSSYASGISANSGINNAVSIFSNTQSLLATSLSTPTSPIYNSNFSYQYFCKDGMISNYLEDGTNLMGWGLYLIKKDGTLDLIATESHLVGQFPFNLESILSSITDMDQYARTSDGYLRARINRNFLHISPEYDYYHQEFLYNKVQHVYIKWFPQKPKLSKKENYLRVSNNSNSYYKNVEIAFGDVAGATSATIVQKEYDGPYVYTVSQNVDISSGVFTATIDKELTTTFQLTVFNDVGTATSDLITYLPEGMSYSANSTIQNNNISISFTDDNNNQSIDNISVVSANITNINGAASTINITNVQNNQINISSLSSGFYGLSIIDENGKTHSVKFRKN